MEACVLLVIDGTCNLCNRTARFIKKRDREQLFIIIASQSKEGEKILKHHGLEQPESVLLIEGERVYEKSDATVEILSRLSGCQWLAFLLKIIPKRIRDYCYGVVARNRYRWFGRQKECAIPDSEFQERFRQ
jgi:predicted DCC family thiol-disulfide oxidoreductase YuxK